MREIGEIDAAPNQLKQADLEEEPHQIFPFPIGEFIEALEEQVCKGKTGKRMKVDRENFEPVRRAYIDYFTCMKIMTCVNRYSNMTPFITTAFSIWTNTLIHGLLNHSVHRRCACRSNSHFLSCPESLSSMILGGCSR